MTPQLGTTVGYGPILTSWQYWRGNEELARLSLAGGSRALVSALELRLREYEQKVRKEN